MVSKYEFILMAENTSQSLKNFERVGLRLVKYNEQINKDIQYFEVCCEIVIRGGLISLVKTIKFSNRILGRMSEADNHLIKYIKHSLRSSNSRGFLKDIL
jgi:hypothetical protein